MTFSEHSKHAELVRAGVRRRDVKLRGTATLKKHEQITFDNLFSGGDSPATGMATYVVAPIASLVGTTTRRSTSRAST